MAIMLTLRGSTEKLFYGNVPKETYNCQNNVTSFWVDYEKVFGTFYTIQRNGSIVIFV